MPPSWLEIPVIFLQRFSEILKKNLGLVQIRVTLSICIVAIQSSIITILWPFSVLFSKSSWFTALDLLLGALLCRGDRTVTRIYELQV